MAAKIGADTDFGPGTMDPTLANGLAIDTVFDDFCQVRGDIVREKSYWLTIRDSNINGRTDDATIAPKIRTSGDAISIHDRIIGTRWDNTGLNAGFGFLIEGGLNPGFEDFPAMTIDHCSLSGAPTLVRVHTGHVEFTNNRLNKHGATTNAVAIRLESDVRNFKHFGNNEQNFVAANNTTDGIVATYLVDNRASTRRYPFLTINNITSDTTLPAAAAFQTLFTAPTYKFAGQWVRINYSVNILNPDSAQWTYTVRVRLGGAVLNETARRGTGAANNSYSTIACNAVVYIPPQEEALSLVLEANQAAGPGPFGIVQAASGLDGSGWYVELV